MSISFDFLTIFPIIIAMVKKIKLINNVNNNAYTSLSQVNDKKKLIRSVVWLKNKLEIFKGFEIGNSHIN